MQPSNEQSLFKGLKFYLSTEVPRYSLEYVILSMGGEVTMGSPAEEGVTHVITDREGVKKERSKEYVQPQWVYDSINNNRLLTVKEYQVGKVNLCLSRHCHLTSHHSWTPMTPKGTSPTAKKN